MFSIQTLVVDHIGVVDGLYDDDDDDDDEVGRGCISGTWASAWLPHCHWRNIEQYG